MEAVSHFKLYVKPKDMMKALASQNETTIGVHSRVYSTHNIPRRINCCDGPKFRRGKLYAKHRRKRGDDKVGLDRRFTRWGDQVEVVHIADRELQVQPGAIMLDVEGKLTLDSVQAVRRVSKKTTQPSVLRGSPWASPRVGIQELSVIGSTPASVGSVFWRIP
jgi:hypothetical protein